MRTLVVVPVDEGVEASLLLEQPPQLDGRPALMCLLPNSRLLDHVLMPKDWRATIAEAWRRLQIDQREMKEGEDNKRAADAVRIQTPPPEPPPETPNGSSARPNSGNPSSAAPKGQSVTRVLGAS
jgi:hypothetical protein